jgi:hypothetical protein
MEAGSVSRPLAERSVSPRQKEGSLQFMFRNLCAVILALVLFPGLIFIDNAAAVDDAAASTKLVLKEGTEVAEILR